MATRSKKLLVAPGLTTRNKKATSTFRFSWHRALGEDHCTCRFQRVHATAFPDTMISLRSFLGSWLSDGNTLLSGNRDPFALRLEEAIAIRSVCVQNGVIYLFFSFYSSVCFAVSWFEHAKHGCFIDLGRSVLHMGAACSCQRASGTHGCCNSIPRIALNN